MDHANASTLQRLHCLSVSPCRPSPTPLLCQNGKTHAQHFRASICAIGRFPAVFPNCASSTLAPVGKFPAFLVRNWGASPKNPGSARGCHFGEIDSEVRSWRKTAAMRAIGVRNWEKLGTFARSGDPQRVPQYRGLRWRWWSPRATDLRAQVAQSIASHQNGSGRNELGVGNSTCHQSTEAP
jgi:hypothetical protein